MAKVIKEVHIEANPDTVWKVVGNIGAVAAWSPMLSTATVHDNMRICTLGENSPAPGSTLKEEILARHEERRRYDYTVSEAPFPIESHHASFQVEPDGTGSKVVWTTDVTPDELASTWEPIFEQQLQALKQYVEN